MPLPPAHSRAERNHRKSPRPGIVYLSTSLIVCLGTAVAIACTPFSQRAPFIFFVPGVLFALWYGGLRPALVATILSTIAADYFLIPPLYSFRVSVDSLVPEFLFVVLLGSISWWLDRQRKKLESSARLRYRLLQAAVESIFVADSEHRIVEWHRGAERMYGWTEPEVLGKKAADVLKTVFPEPLESIDHQLRLMGRWQGRLTRARKNGDVILTESSWAMDLETGWILQTDTDISEKSRTEEELLRLNSALRALSRINQALIHSSEEEQLLQHAVEIMVQEGGYGLAWVGFPENDSEQSIRVKAVAGRASEYVSTAKLSWGNNRWGQGPGGRSIRSRGICVVNDVLADPNCAPWHELARHHQLRSIACIPLLDNGIPIAVLAVYSTVSKAFSAQEIDLLLELAGDLSYGIRSIRVRKDAELERASREALQEQLQQSQKVEAVGRLAGGIAHDFNNLLMVISAQIETLSLHLEGSALERARSIMESTDRAAELTRQLLAFSRKQIVQPRITTLNEILHGIDEIIERLVGENVEVSETPAAEPWSTRVDRSQIEQVIMNLVVNARDAMPDGGKLTIETANCDIQNEYAKTHPLVEPGRYVMLAVTDTGIGMSEETKSRIFEPFFTTKEQGKGTGLGLSMVYGIVKQNNGFIWVYSEPGKGSCFKIYLPATSAPGELGQAGVQPQTAVVRTANVLLVEDEAGLRKVITDFLVSAGHSVVSAESAQAALQVFETHPEIDVLLTDVILTDGNGKELSYKITERRPQTKVVFMSGYTPNAIVHHGVLDETTMFLQKPFTRPVLLAKLQEALES